jgi:AbrB family looped-hinge helix DNA binding protein
METSITTSKGQILVPRKIRNKYGIKSGVKVAFIETKDGVMIKPMDHNYFESFAGILKDALPSTEEFKNMKSEEKILEEKKETRNFRKR